MLHWRRWVRILVCLTPAVTLPSHLAAQDLFRLSDLDLRDPHIFLEYIGCRDVTDTEILGFSFNGTVQQNIQGDANGDGQLDLSFVVEFLPLAQQEAMTLLDRGHTRCKAPMASTACLSLEPWTSADEGTNLAVGSCLSPIADTTRGYTPAIVQPVDNCFASAPGTIALNLSGVLIPLRDLVVAAEYSGDPATQLEDGLIRGFLSEADANATLLPAGYPLIGGQPLSSILAGGSGNCAPHDDRDMNGSTSGWYVYLNFQAPRAQLIPGTVFRNGFELLP